MSHVTRHPLHSATMSTERNKGLSCPDIKERNCKSIATSKPSKTAQDTNTKSHDMRRTSRLTSHMIHVTRHTSHVTCHTSHVTSYLLLDVEHGILATIAAIDTNLKQTTMNNRYQKSQVARHTLHVTPHSSHLTPNTLHVTLHTSHFTPHTSHLTRRTSHVTRHTSHVTPHTSHVTRHTSHVTCWAVHESSWPK
jgi:hypothetical protein